MDRVKALRNFIAAKPDDPFPRYGLAMELKNGGQDAEACEAFAELVERFPDYVATYLMYGTTLASMGKAAEAREILARGIEVAGTAGDAHAKSELAAALSALESGAQG